jgi:IMP dehydrogenase/GMP reductase
VKSAVEGSLKDKMDEEDKETVTAKVTEAEEFLRSLSSDADAEEIKEAHKEMEGECSKIITKYMGGAGPSMGDDEDDEDDEL